VPGEGVFAAQAVNGFIAVLGLAPGLGSDGEVLLVAAFLAYKPAVAEGEYQEGVADAVFFIGR
jgi:hypothetical protein